MALGVLVAIYNQVNYKRSLEQIVKFTKLKLWAVEKI